MSDPRITSSIFTRGAVDLSTLRGPAPASTRPGTPPQGGPTNGAPGAPTAGGDTAIVDVTEATIQSDVLERSMATPVVVFFGAAGFPESDEFAPVLERLNAEGGGTWVLARVDVQENPRIAQMFRVQGVPMVYAVVGGQPVDAFSGVVPEAQLRQWIQAVLKAGGVTVAEPEDPRLDEADDALMSGDLDAAEQAYRKILADAPADAAATAGLAQVGVARRVAGADPSTALAAAESAPDDVAAQLLAADIEVLSGLAEQAYARLVGLVRRTAGEDRETVRQHLVSLFSIAGPDDPAVASARRALASALF
ncbi:MULTISPECIES: tetratricopeptide repeat protein [Micromonospora]|uniref:tetratricopeptide repeat protein n=1 Tax=Micromonospora TaxID=1873 RepID=UPI001EE78C0D|nr:MULTISPECIES: tetratricopeptide repeat protein [Micromonospora]MCG5453119.1 tetratricopeptide repeat protein [Micromonospora hortensis]MCX5120759.1 tetratricopeptide repeat protein [Micromonospora sp. NBC_00362]WTI07301.1 tetratricopeptide repeat protein [Micromonospora sp. NBC_00821]